MAAQPVTLDDLISFVLAQHPGEGPLEHLRDAMLVSQRLSEQADHVIGHFVDQARRAGEPWSAIGEAMGVTKQAAQKRFVPGQPGPDARDLPLNRFTARTRNVVAAARREALASGHRKVGTEHLVLGFMSEPESFAARAIAALGVTEAQLRDRLGAGPAPSPATDPGQIPLDLRARRVIGLSLSEALGFGHNYIGTEHVLLGILAEGKTAGAKVLTGLGITAERARGWLTEALEESMTARERDGESAGT